MQRTDKNIRYSFKEYKKEKGEDKVDLKTYIELCNNYNKFLMEKVFKGFEVTLPCKLGTFQIIGTRHEISFNEKGEPNLAPDWVKTKELWEKCPECKEKKQRIFHTNDHTEGVRYKLHWSKKRVLIRNKSLFSFRLTRDNKRKIHSKVVDENKEYFIKN